MNKDKLVVQSRVALLLIAGSIFASGAALGEEGASGGARPGSGFEPGETLGASSWERARGLLPDEILTHYRRGEFENRIGRMDESRFRFDADFERATTENRGKYHLADDGTILDASGKQPPFVYGFPFPDIDEKDPQAATKIAWNFFYTYYSAGNNYTHQAKLAWLDAQSKKPERFFTVNARFQYWDGIDPDRRPAANPNNLLSQSISWVTEPADLQGIISLGWRYRDGAKRDSDWSYVPALRRVRQVSPTNRSDGFLGSDITSDDSFYFDGKVQDFSWRLVGKKRELVRYDPESLTGQHRWAQPRPGVWRVIRQHVPREGWHDASWKGLPWAPLDDQLVDREVYEVEVTPKDRYYLYGRIVLRFDTRLFRGTYNSKYDWKGEVMQVYSPVTPFGSPDGKKFYPYLATVDGVTYGENIKMNRATSGGDELDFWEDLGLPFEPAVFDVQALTQGK
jgi:hypothetical protein